MGRNTEVVSLALLCLLLGPGCNFMPWSPDCSRGECGEVVEEAEARAERADFDLADHGDHPVLVPDGDTLVFTGRVLDDFAEITLQAEGGEWYDLQLYSLGLPEPSFSVFSDQHYERFSPRGEPGVAHRTIAIPESGEYRIEIHSDRFHRTYHYNSPEDDRSWAFVMEITARPMPEPQYLDVYDGMEIELDAGELDERLFILRTEDPFARLRIDRENSAGRGNGTYQYGDALQYFTASSNPRRLELSVSAHPDGPLVLFDYLNNTGGDAVFTYAFTKWSELGPQEYFEEQHRLEVGEVLVLQNRHREETALQQRSYTLEIRQDQEILATKEPDFSSNGFRGALHKSVTGGEYTLRMRNPYSQPIIDGFHHVDVITVTDLGEVSAEEILEHNRPNNHDLYEVALFRFDLTETANLRPRTNDGRTHIKYRVFADPEFTDERVAFDDSTGSEVVELPEGRYYVLAHPLRLSNPSLEEHGFRLQFDPLE